MTTGESPVSTLIGDGTLDLTTGVMDDRGSTKISLSKSIASSAIPVSGAAAMNTDIEVPNTNPEAVGTKTWEQIFTTAGVTTTQLQAYILHQLIRSCLSLVQIKHLKFLLAIGLLQKMLILAEAILGFLRQFQRLSVLEHSR